MAFEANRIGDAGAVALSEALKVNTSITEICLDGEETLTVIIDLCDDDGLIGI